MQETAARSLRSKKLGQKCGGPIFHIHCALCPHTAYFHKIYLKLIFQENSCILIELAYHVKNIYR